MFRNGRFALVLLFVCSAWGQTPAALPAASANSLDARFAALKKSPLDLYAFLYRMPKGGDLHNHLSGAIYAESFVDLAAKEKYCVDPKLLAIVGQPNATCAAPLVSASQATSDNSLRNALIDAMSMRAFVPTSGRSGHDHFFDTFAKFGVDSDELIGEVVQRAADQNESYLELMTIAGGGAFSALGRNVDLTAGFDAARRQIPDAGLDKAVQTARARIDRLEATRMASLGCRNSPVPPACKVEVRYLYQVLREFSPEQVFAQAVGGFALAAAEPRLVAVNFVQPEDGVVSMRDYHLQMTMVDYAKKLYPAVHITLHAGELVPGLVPPDGLRFHIREAVELGHAERIGHGVDIMYEQDPAALMAKMRASRVAVEINLISNEGILGVIGDQHPFPVYRKNGVPVALSTDDEGVSRSNMTEQYVRAAADYHLSYSDLKQLARNSLEYSFAAGQSYWKTPAYNAVATPCAAGRQSPRCSEFLEKNDKARIEADLEARFAAFEKSEREKPLR